MYKPIKKGLRNYISPGLIFGSLRYPKIDHFPDSFKTDATNSTTYQWHAADKYDKQHECIKISVFDNTKNFRTRKYDCLINFRTLERLFLVEASTTKFWQAVWHNVITKGLLGMLWWRHGGGGTCLSPWIRLVNDIGFQRCWAFIRDDVINIFLHPKRLVFSFACSAWVRTTFVNAFTFVFRCARFASRARRTKCTHHIQIFSHDATKPLSDAHWSFSFGVAQGLRWEGIEQ